MLKDANQFHEKLFVKNQYISSAISRSVTTDIIQFSHFGTKYSKIDQKIIYVSVTSVFIKHLNWSKKL